MTEAKPCPFCGTSGIKIDVKPHGVLCHGCGAWMPSRVSTDITRNHTAIEGWNRRVKDDRISYMTNKLYKTSCAKCEMDIYTLSEQVYNELQAKMIPELRGLCQRCVDVKRKVLNLYSSCKRPI